MTTFLPHIPPAAPKRIAVRVTRTAEKQIRRGHPWLFDGSITEVSHQGQAGDLAVVFDHKRRFLAIGLFDPAAPIRVRLLHHNRPATIDAAWFHERLRQAAARRTPLLSRDTTGYRLVYGEGDQLSGLIIDRYEDTFVVKLYSAAWFPHLNHMLDGLLRLNPINSNAAVRVVLRLSRMLQETPDLTFGLQDGHILVGDPLDGPIRFSEYGVRFAADVQRGHKTGFFFDQRENRQRVGQLAQGKRVLDLFTYAGGFALWAAHGGATRVTGVDVSAPALAAAKQNFQLNPTVDVSRFEPVCADVFRVLEHYAKERQIFDLIVVDPPSFAKRQEEIEPALSQYRRLTEFVLRVLAPQGMLVFASCSSRISAAQFFPTIFEAAEEAGRPLWEQFRTGHALDHPLLEAFPEGAYLKCLFATTID